MDPYFRILCFGYVSVYRVWVAYLKVFDVMRVRSLAVQLEAAHRPHFPIDR